MSVCILRQPVCTDTPNELWQISRQVLLNREALSIYSKLNKSFPKRHKSTKRMQLPITKQRIVNTPENCMKI